VNKRKPITLHRLRELHAAGEKIAMLTCYDAAFARVLDEAGADSLLVGDSLGNVLQGRSSTLGVSIEEMAYHTGCVARGNRTAWIIADLPFGSYQESAEVAMRNAALLMEQGAHMVKLEGGGWTAPIVRFLVDRGVPICAHLGFTPQSVHALGGYRVQGRGEAAAEVLRRPGPGPVRYAGIDGRRTAAVRAQFSRRQRRHRSRRAKIRGRRESRPISGRCDSQLLTRKQHADNPDGRRIAGSSRAWTQARARADPGQPACRPLVAGAHCAGERRPS